jgi:hypothetical protein
LYWLMLKGGEGRYKADVEVGRVKVENDEQ